MMIFFRFLFFFLLINTLSSHDPRISPQSTSFHHVLEFLHVRAKIPHPSPSFSFTLSSLLPFVINDTTCQNDLILLMHGIRNEEKWALKIIDSWGVKPSAGILEGSHIWLGSYDECLHPLYLSTNRTHVKQPYLTKYCTLSTQQNDDDPVFLQKPALIMGICLPNSCHSTDFQSKFVLSIKSILFFYTSSFRSLHIQCPSERRHFSYGAIFTLSLIILLTLFVCFAIFIPRLNEYSMTHTLKKIFSLNQTHSTYSFLNGIRVLSLLWVIFGHSFLFQLTMADNVIHVLDTLHNSYAMQLVSGAIFGVDTFFFISGFLAVFIFLNTFKNQDDFRIQHLFLYYFHRYCRLIPTLVFILLVSIYLTPWMGDGPMYPTASGFETPACRQQWWTTVLFLNNFIKPETSCLPVTW